MESRRIRSSEGLALFLRKISSSNSKGFYKQILMKTHLDDLLLNERADSLLLPLDLTLMDHSNIQHLNVECFGPMLLSKISMACTYSKNWVPLKASIIITVKIIRSIAHDKMYKYALDLISAV